ncbi:hypothetical protein V6N12_070278 [Hibiscus sabdariffa]|uniref:Uncharacterized protein n=1 Tax=Hibiscus sabdariffa TaxID=183260 RepID=A0ABR2FGC0_9ROSI
MEWDVSLRTPPRRSRSGFSRGLIDDGGLSSHVSAENQTILSLAEKIPPHNCANFPRQYPSSNKAVDSSSRKSSEKYQSDLSTISTQFPVIIATINDSRRLLAQLKNLCGIVDQTRSDFPDGFDINMDSNEDSPMASIANLKRPRTQLLSVVSHEIDSNGNTFSSSAGLAQRASRDQ